MASRVAAASRLRLGLALTGRFAMSWLLEFFETPRRSPPWSHGPDRRTSRDGAPRFTAETAETAEKGTEPGERVGRVRRTEARCALGHLLGVFLGGLCGLRGESVPSLAA